MTAGLYDLVYIINANTRINILNITALFKAYRLFIAHNS